MPVHASGLIHREEPLYVAETEEKKNEEHKKQGRKTTEDIKEWLSYKRLPVVPFELFVLSKPLGMDNVCRQVSRELAM